ncbi:MAG: hypothetical protein VX000_16690 [Myxococcota bacterium]|nr:hypothetical protein [Myxococcota bacterium]
MAIGVALTLASLCCVVGYPALLDPTGHALGGGGGDLNGLAWTLWRVVDAAPRLARAHPDIQWPLGAYLAPVAVPQAFLTAPVTVSLGPVASVNLLQVAHVAMAGGLAAAWTDARGATLPGAVTAGLTFGLAPVLLASVHNGNPDVTPIFWLPLAGLLAARAAASWRAAMLLGVALGLAPGWSPYAGVMSCLVAVVVVSWPRSRAEMGRLATVAALGATGLGLWAAFYTGGMEGEASLVLKRTAAPVEPGSASLRGFIDPGTTGGGGDGWTRHRWYLGWTALALAGLGTRVLGQRSTRLIALLIVGVLLSLGPTLLWDGAPVDLSGRFIAMPGAAWIRIPGLDGLRLVWRYAALASLAVAILAAHGISALPGRLRWPASCLVALELLLLGGIADLRAGPVIDDGSCALLADRPAGPVLALPFGHDERSLLGQTCHGMPVAGSLNRVPDRTIQAGLQEGPEALAALGFRWLILDTSSTGQAGGTLTALADALGSPVSTAEGFHLYDLGEQP